MNKRFIQLMTMLLLVAGLSFFYACEEPGKVESKDLVLSCDKDSIAADSVQSVVFKVMYGEKDVTGDSFISCVDDKVELPDSVFVTKAVGTHTFEARYREHVSNRVSVKAVEPVKDSIDNGEPTFVIELTDLNATGVNMRIVPVNYEGGYYFDVVTEESYAYYTENGWQELIDYTVSNIANDYQMSEEEALRAIMSYGPDEWTFQNLDYNTGYHAVAMGVDGIGFICTDVVEEAFRTPDVEMSENTFEITISNITYDGADYTVIPSDKEATYFSMIVSKVVADEFETDEELVGYCKSLVPDPNMLVTKGDFTLKNQKMSQPGRDFYVVAFGYESGVVTTEITKETFSTMTDGDPATCSFDFNIGKVTHNSVELSITPSNRFNVYFSELITMEDLNIFKGMFDDDVQKAMEYYWNEGILAMLEADMGLTPAQFTDVVCIWGDLVGGTDHSTIDFLDMDTEYIAYAVCLDANGQPEGDFYFSKAFITEKEVISSVSADMKVVGYFDGNEIEGEWNTPGQAVVVMEITPSEDAVCWYADLFADDISSSGRYNIIKNLTVYGGVYKPTILIATTPWNYTCTAVAIAQDADENYGAPSFEVFECYKENILPVEEFYQYESQAQSQSQAQPR